MMGWFINYTGTDMAPIFTEGESGVGRGAKKHGPYDTLEGAVVAADRELRSDINILRRALSALRRGDFCEIHAEESK